MGSGRLGSIAEINTYSYYRSKWVSQIIPIPCMQYTLAMQPYTPRFPNAKIPCHQHESSKPARLVLPNRIHHPISIVPARLFFATCAVPVFPPCKTTPVAVQLVPQAYPLGQHPPPCPLAQLNHPNAHALAPKAASPVPLGMTDIVTPLEFIAKVEDCAGQDVRPQSRPTRQQPA